MSIDILTGPEHFDQRIERLAREGEVQQVVDEVAYAGYDESGETMQFLKVDTHHEGVVHLGGDISPNTVPLNEGQVVVVPLNESKDAMVMRAEVRKRRFGGTTKVLAQHMITDVFGEAPEVSAEEPQPFKAGQGLSLDVDQLGYVKVVDRSNRLFAQGAVQELAETAALTPQQRAEFGIVGASLKALDFLPKK